MTSELLTSTARPSLCAAPGSGLRWHKTSDCPPLTKELVLAYFPQFADVEQGGEFGLAWYDPETGDWCDNCCEGGHAFGAENAQTHWMLLNDIPLPNRISSP
jgi:hypothetical protein